MERCSNNYFYWITIGIGNQNRLEADNRHLRAEASEKAKLRRESVRQNPQYRYLILHI